MFYCVFPGFCYCFRVQLFYYNPPIHVPCDDNITDYKRENNVVWFRGTEGFCMGTIDDNGYHNTFVPDKVDFLCMGSSQTEGLYVNTNETYCSVMNQMFEDSDIPLNGYNIGMSSHNLFKNIFHLPAVLSKYHPSYVIIETSTLKATQSQAKNVLEHNNSKLTSYSKDNLMYWIQKNPYIKLLYLQVKNYTNKRANDVPTPVDSSAKPATEENKMYLVLNYLNELAEKYHFTPVIFYLPSIDVSEQSVCVDDAYRTEFAELCEKYGIIFADMTEPFNLNYQESYIVPTGFPNTSVGYGHLNKNGHLIIGQTLFSYLTEYERGLER